MPDLKDDPENTEVSCFYGISSSFLTSSISVSFLELGNNQILKGTDQATSKGTLLPFLLVWTYSNKGPLITCQLEVKFDLSHSFSKIK